jgi:hypothetical protein
MARWAKRKAEENRWGAQPTPPTGPGQGGPSLLGRAKRPSPAHAAFWGSSRGRVTVLALWLLWGALVVWLGYWWLVLVSLVVAAWILHWVTTLEVRRVRRELQIFSRAQPDEEDRP